VSSREERVAGNETTTREINEGIEQAHTDEEGSTGEGEHVRILCECGREACDRVLAISIADYEDAGSQEPRIGPTR
jgi:hypothetical protein